MARTYNVTLPAYWSIDLYARDEVEALDIAKEMAQELNARLWPESVYINHHVIPDVRENWDTVEGLHVCEAYDDEEDE